MSVQPPSRARPTEDARPDSSYILIVVTFTLIQGSFIVTSTDLDKAVVVGYDTK